MEREPILPRETQISYKTEEKTVLRGYNLSDLAEEGYSFCDALFVIFQSRIPTENEEKMLEYEMAGILGAFDVTFSGGCHQYHGGKTTVACGHWRWNHDLWRGPWPRSGSWLHDEQIFGAGSC